MRDKLGFCRVQFNNCKVTDTSLDEVILARCISEDTESIYCHAQYLRVKKDIFVKIYANVLLNYLSGFYIISRYKKWQLTFGQEEIF